MLIFGKIFNICRLFRESDIIKTKILKRRKNIKIIFVVLFVFFIAFMCNKTYINNKCRDLYFATEYFLTKGSNNRLLRVQNFELVFLDNNMAIVEAFGLNKESPHEEVTIRATFKRNNKNTWKLDKNSVTRS